MKKSLLLSLAFAALLMTGCRKTDVQPAQGGHEFGDFEMSLTAGNGDDEKSSIEGLKIYWQLGDKLHVVDSNDMRYLGYLTATEIGDPKTTATFKGFITQPTANHRCKFYFVGSNNFNIDDDGNYLFDVHEQYGGLSIYVGNAANDDYEPGTWKGDFNDISNGLQLMKNRNAITVDETMLAAHNFGDQIIHMRSMMAISHINLQVNGTSMGGELSDIVTVSGAGCYSTGTLNIKTGTLTPNAGNITLKKANGDYYMVLIPETPAGSDLALTFTATSRDGEVKGITPTVAANKFYNKDTAKEINMTNLYLPGEFSVSAGTKVHFSQGNLYYNGNGTGDYPGNPSLPSGWNFYGHQYDYCTYGADSEGYGTATESDEISLFTWGYGDWSTVYNTTSYQEGSGVTMDDWGTQVGDGQWRTLSSAEWVYVLNTSGSSGRTDANRFAKAMVNGVKGLVVFPDDYNGNVVITPPDGMAEINTGNAAFPEESIADNIWSAMESAGAVFLPAAGSGGGTDVYGVGLGVPRVVQFV